MTIKFLDLRRYHAERREEYLAAVAEVIDSGWFIMGPQLEAFEAEFAEYCQARGAVGVGTGLDALKLILKGYDIGPGDEVIVPAHTFIATFLAVSAVGATPVPVDVDPFTMNIDTDRVESAISGRTKAIIGVHLYGRPCEADVLRAIAAQHGLVFIEDAAQSHGAMLDGRRTGVFGHAAAFSFYPGKNLGALGDGGAVVSNDLELIGRLRSLRNYGSTKKYVHFEQGENSRLDEIQAALLRVKLRNLDSENSRRQAIAEVYCQKIKRPDITLPLANDERVRSAWHLFVVRTAARDSFFEHLRVNNIESAVHYPIPCYRQGAYKGAYPEPDYPVSDALAQTVLSLPISPILDDGSVDQVVAAVNGWGR